MDNYKLKLIIFISLLIILVTSLYYAIFGSSVSYKSVKEIKSERKETTELIKYLKINDIDTVYDKKLDLYYYSIPMENKDKNYVLKLNLEDNLKYKIYDYNTNLINVEYNKEYKIIIYNEKKYQIIKVKFTNLPLIDIESESNITDNETNTIFKYINPSNLDQVITESAKMKVRGATTRWYDKKSYKVEFYNSSYDKEKNINIDNFYYGSSFILDGLYRDNSKIRNVLAINLWNEISNDFNNVDVYSEFVEVFVNGEYLGLYAFTEPINRKKLNLDKSSLNDTSVIVKSNQFNPPKANTNYSNIIDDQYMDYELKYPNDETLFARSWESILSKLIKYYNTNKKDYDLIEDTFVINNYVDLMLFNSFINNKDNKFTKNNYFYLKSLSDTINIQPWDMEFSFGLSWSTETEANFILTLNDYKDIEIDIKHPYAKKINNLIINRYWNLRSNVLTDKYLDNLLDKYNDELTQGAALRDSEKWLEYDVSKEISNVKTWLHNRIKVYDNYIRGLENE